MCYLFYIISHDRSPISESSADSSSADVSKLDFNMGGPRGIKQIPDSRNIMAGD